MSVWCDYKLRDKFKQNISSQKEEEMPVGLQHVSTPDFW